MNWSETLQNWARRVWSSVNLKAIRGSIRHPFAIGCIYTGWCFAGALWLNIYSQKSFWWDIVQCTICKGERVFTLPSLIPKSQFQTFDNTKNTVLQETCNIWWLFLKLRSGEQRADTIGGSRKYPWCWNHQVGKQPLHPWCLELCSSQLLCQGAPDEDTNTSWSKSSTFNGLWWLDRKLPQLMLIDIGYEWFIPLRQIDIKWLYII